MFFERLAEIGAGKLAIAFTTAFVFISVFEILLHGFALRQVYADVGSALRDHEEAPRFFVFGLAGYAFTAVTALMLAAWFRPAPMADFAPVVIIVAVCLAAATALGQIAAYRVPSGLAAIWIPAGAVQFSVAILITRFIIGPAEVSS